MPTGNCGQRGFTFVGLLIAVVFFGLASVGAARLLASTERGEREAELLFVGHQFRQAIASYYRAGPVAGKYPAELKDLLQDPRSPTPRRHLRKLFVDPVTGKADWGLVMAPEGGIMGVHSLSEREPLTRANFDPQDADIEQAIAQLLGLASPLPAQAASSPSPLRPASSSVQLTGTGDGPYSYKYWKFVYRAGRVGAVPAPNGAVR